MAGSCLNTPVPVSADGGWMADWKRKGIFLALKSFFSWQELSLCWLWRSRGGKLASQTHRWSKPQSTHPHTHTNFEFLVHRWSSPLLSHLPVNVCQLILSSNGYYTSVSVKIMLVLSCKSTSHHKILTSWVCVFEKVSTLSLHFACEHMEGAEHEYAHTCTRWARESLVSDFRWHYVARQLFSAHQYYLY